MTPDLLLFDLDGTLLDTDRTIRPATLQVLQTLMQRGVRVGFATGRSPVSVRRFVDELRPTGPLILFNGCVLWDVENAAPAASHNLPHADAIRLARATVELGIHANVYIGESLYVAHRGPLSLASEAKDGVPHTEVPNLVAHVEISPPPFKFLCIHPGGDFAALRARIDDELESACTVVQSEPEYLEVLPPGVNKGALLAAIDRIYGVPASRVAAFGDELNDVELLQAAGHAVVMGNARDEVKAHADVVIGANTTDAIATYLTEVFEL